MVMSESTPSRQLLSDSSKDSVLPHYQYDVLCAVLVQGVAHTCQANSHKVTDNSTNAFSIALSDNNYFILIYYEMRGLWLATRLLF